MARLARKYDATADDSSKSWVVPDGEIWEILYVHAKLVTTATVGNRIMSLIITDENNNDMIDIFAGNLQAASATVHYWMGQGVFRETSVVNGEIHMPIPDDFYINSGWTITIEDSAGIAAAADDMTVSIVYKVRTPGEM